MEIDNSSVVYTESSEGLSVSFTECDSCLKIIFQGSINNDNYPVFIDMVREIGGEFDHKCLVVDLRETIINVSNFNRMNAGREMAEKWAFNFKIAILLKREDYNGIAEVVANNRGVPAKAFFTEEDAKKWF